MARFLTLNIGAARAVLAEYVLKGKTGPELSAYGEAPLPPLDSDTPGALRATLVPLLLDLMREHGMRPAPLALSLNGQMVFPRFAKFPPVDKDKLEQMVQYEVEQNVPFPIDEIVCDHQFTGETADGDVAAMIVAAKIEQVREITEAVSGAGLEPKIIDVGPMAIFNVLKNVHPDFDGCTVVLDVGGKATNLIIVEDEKIYTRTISTAGNTITREIMNAFGCTNEEAEQAKLERAYVAQGGVTEDEDEVTDRVSKIVRTVLTRLNAEVMRSVQFYRSQQGGSAPVRLLLTGGTARLPQIDDFFADAMGVEVGFLDPFAGDVTVGPRLDGDEVANDSFSLAESAGLALRMSERAEMEINLIPPELVAKARARKRIPFLAVGAACSLLALVAGIFTLDRSTAVAREKLARLTNEERMGANDRLDKAAKALKEAQRAYESELGECDEFQKNLVARTAVLRRLDMVRRSLVPGMWIFEWAPIVEKGKETNGARVTIRGWTDQLTAAEKAYRDSNGGKKTTASEIVRDLIRANPLVLAESVKIDMQNDVKGCITEFAIKMAFADSPSCSGSGKKKGVR